MNETHDLVAQTRHEIVKDAIDMISFYKIYVDFTFEDEDYHSLCCMLDGLIHFVNQAKDVVARHYPHQVQIPYAQDIHEKATCVRNEASKEPVLQLMDTSAAFSDEERSSKHE